MKKIILLIFILNFFAFISYSQQVIPIDTIDNFTVLKKIKTTASIDGKKYVERKLYINIPLTLDYKISTNANLFVYLFFRVKNNL